MAFQISSTTVIDDSRNITNIVNTTLTGTISVNGSVGTAGQFLTSNGSSAAYWSTPSSLSQAKAIALAMTLGF